MTPMLICYCHSINLSFAIFQLDLWFTEVAVSHMIFWVVTLCSSVEVHSLPPFPRSKSKPCKKPAISTRKHHPVKTLQKNGLLQIPALHTLWYVGYIGMYWNVDRLIPCYIFQRLINYPNISISFWTLMSKHVHICTLFPLQLLIN
jgi:hypothetical protein